MAKMPANQEKYLEHIRKATDRASGYPGLPLFFVPDKIADVLKRQNFIEEFVPYNPNHNVRWTITDAGRAALEANNGRQNG